MSSPEDIAGPSSPSLLSDVSRKRKIKVSSKDQAKKTYATKETQVTSEDIMSAIMYKLSLWDANQLKCDVSNLPPLNFEQPGPSEPRNANFGRLVAFELDRVPEEKRSVTYVNLLNLIRKVRQQKDLDGISLPNYEESD